MRSSPETVLCAAVWIAVTGAFGATSAAKCGKYQFACLSGSTKCISDFDKCDGAKNCEDGSDETFELCSRFGRSCSALPFSFKCAYGACIDKVKRCDGVANDCADNSDELNCAKGSPETPVNSTCGSWQFPCVSGGCLNLTEVCDGVANCKDGSDETIAQCSQMNCPQFAFQCKYGACIDFDGKCNNKPNCVDGSDEDNCPNRNADEQNKADEGNSTVAVSCPFPSHANTIYKIPGCSSNECQPSPGKHLMEFSAVIASCPPGFSLPSEYRDPQQPPTMICFAPDWNPQQPVWNPHITCEKLCPPLVSEFHDLDCKLKGTPVPCDQPMPRETRVKLPCKENFRHHSSVAAVSETKCLSDGTWSYNLTRCVPECGKSQPMDGTKEGSRDVQPGKAPWHAGLWGMKTGIYKQFCGGTLIAPHLVVTAAQCLTKYLGPDRTDDYSNIMVTVGKFNRQFDPRGEHEQRAGVANVWVRRGYKGPPDHEKDLAVVTLNQSLELNSYTLPACVAWNLDGPEGFPVERKGYVVGFSRNQLNETSETLQAGSIHHIGFNRCYKLLEDGGNIPDLQSGSRKVIKWDQFCGRLDVGITPTTMVPGDTGGGYVFRKGAKYYLYGVFSGQLTGRNMLVYTNLLSHIKKLKAEDFHEILV